MSGPAFAYLRTLSCPAFECKIQFTHDAFRIIDARSIARPADAKLPIKRALQLMRAPSRLNGRVLPFFSVRPALRTIAVTFWSRIGPFLRALAVLLPAGFLRTGKLPAFFGGTGALFVYDLLFTRQTFIIAVFDKDLLFGLNTDPCILLM